MTEPTRKWRRGLRQGAYSAVLVGTIVVMGLPKFPDYTVGRARLEFFGMVLGTFIVVWGAYALGVIKPGGKGKSDRINPWAAVAVMLVLAYLVYSGF